MHYTLHLTNDCNLGCHYCYVHKQARREMTLKIAKAAIDHAAENAGRIGISFFGGEPLLKKDLIKAVIRYARESEQYKKCTFHFKITTNGTLLNTSFLRFCTDNRIMIALSIDGIQAAHDAHRIFKDGTGSFASVEKAAKILLKFQPYACAMMVVNPDTIQYYADGIQSLFDIGFKYFICSLNYEKQAAWTDAHMEELARQFDKLSELYIAWTLDEEKFYFSPFEVKMRSFIDGEAYCQQRCQLGQRQLSVDTDGALYPCVQFVGEKEYCIGDVYNGVDEQRRKALFLKAEKTSQNCIDCAIKERCNHHCGCLNKQATGDINGISPVLCAHERIALTAADRTAGILFEKKSSMFLQKQYNEMYPLISLIEDKSHLSKNNI
ncbi:MAG: radical SAM protein [Christensenellales bacterium]|jgi:uncharacterized protein